MSLTQTQIDEIADLADRFVGAFVKCGCGSAKYTVCSSPCETLDQAVLLSIVKCGRINVSSQDSREQEILLQEKLFQAIKSLK